MKQSSASAGLAAHWRRALFLLLPALLALGVWHWTRPPALPALLTQTVARGNLDIMVTAQGALAPRDYVDVGAQVSGQLRKVYVNIGDQVRKGQLLAEVDPEVYAIKVSADQAAIDDLAAQQDKQQASVLRAGQLLARQQALAGVDATTGEALEQARAGLAEAQATARSLHAQWQKARATLKGDAANLAYTRINSPIDGTVVSQTVLEGQTINASQSAPTLLRVARLDTMTVEAKVAEADIPQLKPGMSAYFTTLGDSRTRHQAVIRQIKPTPTTSNDVVLYTVLLDVANPQHALLINMTAQVFFPLQHVSGLPLVPLTALTPLDGNGRRYRARVLQNGKLVTREVSVRLASRSQAAVASGLSAGEQLVLAEQGAGSTASGMPPPPPGG